MSTSITSPASALAPAFTGVSKFASSLQQVLSRAVGIASLPLDSLNAGMTNLSDKQSALQGLDLAFSALQQSTTGLQTAVSSSLLNSSISDASIVSANVQKGANPGVYSIEVTSLGGYSTALSNAGTTPVSDQTQQGISNSSSLTLTVGDFTTTITPSSTSLQDLAAAINTQASGQAQATIVNFGSNSAPDYRLSLRAANLGAGAIDLTDSNGSLISSSSTGALASYKVGGSSTAITSTSRTINLAPGLTVNLVGQSNPGQPATITINHSAVGLASAFSSFAQSYNAAVDAVNQHHGQNGGVLQGDSLLQSLTGILHQLGTYNNGSAANALANFGVTLDQTGHLSVNTANFTSAANANFPALLTTLGSSASGGFLKTASDLLSGVENATTGIIKAEETSIDGEITSQQTRIANEQAIVNNLQTSLTAQIAKADSAIASLESQVSYVTGLFAQYTGANNTQNNGLSTL